jgi:STE24 endopeptidase
MDQKTKARRYSNIKILIQIIEICLLLLYLVLFQSLGASHLLKECAYRITTHAYGALMIYFMVFSGVYYGIGFPLTYYSGYFLEHRFALSQQTFLAWLKDEAKGALLHFVVSLLLITVLYMLLRSFPNDWWMGMAFFWIALTIVLSRIFPIIIIPLFYKYSAVPNQALRQRLIRLAHRAGITVLDIYQIDFSRKTRKANAALTGLGRSRRIILADTLLRDFSDEEIEVVVSHELGHHALHHIPKTLLFGGIASVLVFYGAHHVLIRSMTIIGAEAIYDIAMFPFLCMVLFAFSLVLLPLQNGYSRRLERASDRFALELTRNKEGFVTMMNKLAEKNLANVTPNKAVEFIFYNHPSIAKRIKFAQDLSL